MSLLNQNDMQKILQSSRTGLWRVEFEEGKAPRFFADAVMDELLGISGEMTEEARYEFHQKRIHPDDRALFEEYASQLTGARAEIVYRYIHPISGEMFVRCGGARDLSATRFVSIIGTHQDISETIRLEKDKMAERRLAELNSTLRKEQERQEDYYREILDLQSCGVMAYTLPGHRMIHMNAEALRMYGVKDMQEAQQNLGNLLRSLYYPDPTVREKLKALRDGNGAVDYECIIGKGTDRECHIMAKTRAVQQPNGEKAVITTFLDVSEMMTLKNALKKAEEGSRAKSAFLFAMSHDLRTPMNAIIGYTQLMEAHWGEKAVTSQYLSKLKGASQFLLSLIGNVLEVSRIENGKETLQEAPWNFVGMGKSLGLILENDMRQKQLTFNKVIQVTHHDVICDAMKIREIIMNLLSNAVKYTPAGGTITLSIKELPSDREGYGVFEMAVSDNGMGIGKEYIPHLFEAFSRERSSSESGIIGTGLGLNIVKSFVDLMGGTIHVESELGKGTCFTVVLTHRLAKPEETAQAHMQKNAQDQEAAQAFLGKKRVLLVEDNELNADIAMTILEDAHVKAELAKDGAEAFDMLARAPEEYYDVILMDIQMPRLNGYEAAKKIRKLSDPYKAQIPIIAMTANAFEEDRQAALAAGMDDYVVKPIEVDRLLMTMAKVLQERKMLDPTVVLDKN